MNYLITENITSRTANKCGPGKWAMIMICAGLIASSTMSWAGERNGGGQGYKNEHGAYPEQDCDSLRRAKFKESVTIATAKLYVEYNHTDDDIGVHGAFDDHGYSVLCIYDPKDKLILELEPENQLKELTMAGIFFESREPPSEEFSFEDLKKNFQEGQYRVRGVTFEGKTLTGAATFSHHVPAAPAITYPTEGTVVSSNNLIVSWEHVAHTVTGEPIDITGYEIIITKEVEDDPNGFSRPTYDVHVPADRNTLAVPTEFLESNTEYELEILALEKSGNQTISVLFFETE